MRWLDGAGASGVGRWIAALLLDVRPYLVNGWWRLGYSVTNIVFCLLPLIYAWGAFAP